MKRTTVLSLPKLSVDLPSWMLLPADTGTKEHTRALKDMPEFCLTLLNFVHITSVMHAGRSSWCFLFVSS